VKGRRKGKRTKKDIKSEEGEGSKIKQKSHEFHPMNFLKAAIALMRISKDEKHKRSNKKEYPVQKETSTARVDGKLKERIFVSTFSSISSLLVIIARKLLSDTSKKFHNLAYAIELKALNTRLFFLKYFIL
jgi:hypothetical protein